jgi:hypothetical protein
MMQVFDIGDVHPVVRKQRLENPMMFMAIYRDIADLHTVLGLNRSMDRVNFPDKTV